MASSWCLSTPLVSGGTVAASASAATSSRPRLQRSRGSASMSLMLQGMRYPSQRRQVLCMAPEEEKMTRRSPLDFPIEWERPKPGRRPDIFPQFSPMKTPLPPPLPADPDPEEDEEDEEKKEEEEEDPDKEENPDQPEK
ncbi:uncharacterized protein LOC131250740 [Magnolia sinica]|uniref:uncharacterized protein LOC131250740 n=1 Tax=Magnolia sinica TaxID=86752 RepID=UPI002659BE90|nr:uncharacterized protein LOC131250740 [Magnolia sinica]XP_058107002.1 uncharacterized protein LOC131250740 [Magnolia sinica]